MEDNACLRCFVTHDAVVVG